MYTLHIIQCSLKRLCTVKHKLFEPLVIPPSYGSQLKGYCDNYNRRDAIQLSTIYILDSSDFLITHVLDKCAK